MADVLTHLQLVRERVENSRVMGSSSEREMAELGKFLLGHSLSTSEQNAKNENTDYYYALSWHQFIPLALVTQNLLYDNKLSSFSSSIISYNEVQSNQMTLSHELPSILSREFDKIVSVCCASHKNKVAKSDNNNADNRHDKRSKTSRSSKLELPADPLQQNKEKYEEEEEEEQELQNEESKFTLCHSFTSCLDEVNSWAEALHYKTPSEHIISNNEKERKVSHHCLIVIEALPSSSFQQYANKDGRININNNGKKNFLDVFVNSAINTLPHSNYSKSRRFNSNINSSSNAMFGVEWTHTAKRSRCNNSNSDNNNNVYTFLHNLACIGDLCSARSNISVHTCHFAVLVVLQEHKFGQNLLYKALQREFGYKYTIKLHAQEDMSANDSNINKWNDMSDMYSNYSTSCTNANHVHSALYQEIIELWNPELLLSLIRSNTINDNNDDLLYHSITSDATCNKTENFNVKLSQLIRQESALFCARPCNWSLSHFLMKSLQMYPLLMTSRQLKQCQSIWSLRHSLRDVLRGFHLMLTNSYSTKSSAWTDYTNKYNKKGSNTNKQNMERRYNSPLNRYEESMKIMEMLLDVSLMLTNQMLCKLDEKYNVERSAWPSNEILQSIFFMLLYTELTAYSSNYHSKESEQKKESENKEHNFTLSSSSSEDLHHYHHHHHHHLEHDDYRYTSHRLLRFPIVVDKLAEIYNNHCGEKYECTSTKLDVGTSCSNVIQLKSKNITEIEQEKKKNKNKAIMTLCHLLPFSSTNNDDDINSSHCKQNESLQGNVVQLPEILIPPDLKTSLGKQLEHTLLTSLIPPHASLSDLRNSEWHAVPYLWEYSVEDKKCYSNENNYKIENNGAVQVMVHKRTHGNGTLSRKNFYSSSVSMFMRILYLLSVHNVTNKSVSSKDKYISLAKVAAVCMLSINNYDDNNDYEDDDREDDFNLLRVLHELQVCGFVDLMRDKDSGEVKIRSLLE